MKHLNTKLLHAALLLGFVFSTPALVAQQYKVDVEDPSFEDLQSPEVGGNTGKKKFKAKDWLECEVKFKIESSDSRVKFVDKVTVKWYVAAENPDGKGYVLLSKEVNHINVPVNEDVYASVYLSPTSIMRISGSDRAGKSVLSHVGGEILVNGTQPVKQTGYFTSKDKPGWWTKAGLSSYDKIPLLNKSETPFEFLWWDRYAEIEVPK
ncbi:MAG: Amuc_1102 family pilus-like protein [Akkermansiaceae bacterium]